MLSRVNAAMAQYLIVTANYWVFTLTDGALRMLVVLHFHQLGYSPLAIAMLFIFYEVFGVVTNLVGGWLGARIGLNRTMNIGLGLQIVALALLLVPTTWLTVAWVMFAQALSGIAKDLNKMSAKSAIKQLVPSSQQQQLFRWVATLTGSKNALKGVGFFLGGLLLTSVGFQTALIIMIAALILAWLASLYFLKREFGRAKSKPKFRQMFSNNRAINILSAARLFLFAARDVWFVVALPVFFASQLAWSHAAIGSFFALWIIFYGAIQALTPSLIKATQLDKQASGWAIVLLLITLSLLLIHHWHLDTLLIFGLFVFGAGFAINSSLHSYLVVYLSREDGASLDIGFYYMANAIGRLLGTVLSGWMFQLWGLGACLATSAALVALSALCARCLPHSQAAG